MNDDRNNASASATDPEQRKQRASRRLLAALLLIGVAIVGLALMERWRQRPEIAAPSHEPSQALIAPPEPPAGSAQTDHPSEPPPPPQVVNSDKAGASAKPAAAPPAASSRAAAKPAGAAIPAYVVQAGVFNSPANAQALQNKLVKAGIPAHTETRVQLGPFRDRVEAERALAKVRKLGVNAVLVAPR